MHLHLGLWAASWDMVTKSEFKHTRMQPSCQGREVLTEAHQCSLSSVTALADCATSVSMQLGAVTGCSAASWGLVT